MDLYNNYVKIEKIIRELELIDIIGVGLTDEQRNYLEKLKNAKELLSNDLEDGEIKRS